MSVGLLEPEPGVRCVVADNASAMTLDGTRNYLIGGGRAVLVDPGPSAGQRDRARRLAEDRRIAAVALTHAHGDHADGAPELAEEIGAPLVASAGTLRRLGVEGTAAAEGDMLPADPPGGAAADGGAGPADEPGPPASRPGGGAASALRVLETPGHTRDGLSYWWPSRGGLFVGDLVLGSGSAMVAHPDGHMGDYLATLGRLAELRPRRIYPGHGEPVADPLARLDAYREHRLERERRVRRAVEEGARSVEDVRRRAYDELPEGLERAAGACVRAHLVHLREGGHDLPEIAGF